MKLLIADLDVLMPASSQKLADFIQSVNAIRFFLSPADIDQMSKVFVKCRKRSKVSLALQEMSESIALMNWKPVESDFCPDLTYFSPTHTLVTGIAEL